ncbi:MAG: AtpZ/AtpI family protein [Myxococcota bacterium]|nr:AtpZ/AtpI family protein [Myxococcota bacterium]
MVESDEQPSERAKAQQAAERAERRRMWRQAGQFGSIGIEFVVATAIGFLAGRWLDRWWGTWPWMALFLTLCGIAAASRDLFLLARKAKREAEQDGP